MEKLRQEPSTLPLGEKLARIWEVIPVGKSYFLAKGPLIKNTVAKEQLVR